MESPLPFKVKVLNETFATVVDANGKEISGCEACGCKDSTYMLKETAEAIVKAVNVHTGLLTLLYANLTEATDCFCDDEYVCVRHLSAKVLDQAQGRAL